MSENMKPIKLPVSILTKKQIKRNSKIFEEGGRYYEISVKLRYDDSCGNGHNTFAITGEIWRTTAKGSRLNNDCEACGCIHNDIVKHFPELVTMIQWHSCNSDGPLHYLANTVYVAGDRDYNKLRAGAPCSWKYSVKFAGFPILWSTNTHNSFFEWLQKQSSEDIYRGYSIVEVPHTSKDGYIFNSQYTIDGLRENWGMCPFNSRREAEQFIEAMRSGYTAVKEATDWSKGKARELDFARRLAIWPEATDEELCADPDVLKEMLIARLPALMLRFKEAMESLGFVY